MCWKSNRKFEKKLVMSAPHPYVIPTKTGWIVLCMPFNLGRVRYVSNNVIKVSCLIFHRNCDGKAWILKFPILLFFTLFTPFRGQISILDIMFIYKVYSTHHKLQNDGSHMNVSESWDFFIEQALDPFWHPLKKGFGHRTTGTPFFWCYSDPYWPLKTKKSLYTKKSYEITQGSTL